MGEWERKMSGGGEQAMDRFTQFFRIHRFRQIVVHSGLYTKLPIPSHCICRRGDDGNLRVEDAGRGISDAPGRLKSVHFWHLAVHQDQIVRNARKRINCFETVGGRIRAIAEFFEYA